MPAFITLLLLLTCTSRGLCVPISSYAADGDVVALLVDPIQCVRVCAAPYCSVCLQNWAGMRCPYKLLRMILALVCMSSEVGRAVWLRFSPPLPSTGPQPSFMAHLSGAVVGVSMGLLILRSYEESLPRQCAWWIIVSALTVFFLFAIFWNIFAYELLGVQVPPAP